MIKYVAYRQLDHIEKVEIIEDLGFAYIVITTSGLEHPLIKQPNHQIYEIFDSWGEAKHYLIERKIKFIESSNRQLERYKVELEELKNLKEIL